MRTETATLEILSPSITIAPFASSADAEPDIRPDANGKARTYPTPFRATTSKAAPEEAASTPLTRHSDDRPSRRLHWSRRTRHNPGSGSLIRRLECRRRGQPLPRFGPSPCPPDSRMQRGGEPQAVVDRCRIVFLTVPDDVITQVASSLDWPADRGVVHCSGAGTTELLSPAATAGALCGSFHPLQTFTSLPTDKTPLSSLPSHKPDWRA